MNVQPKLIKLMHVFVTVYQKVVFFLCNSQRQRKSTDGTIISFLWLSYWYHCSCMRLSSSERSVKQSINEAPFL